MPKIFSISRYDQIVKETVDKIVELGVKKGGEYAGDVDRLANFRRNGDAAGVPMELIWRIYVSKHWDAIMQYERDLRTGKTRPRMEGLDGRVDDIIVYLLLFKAMLLERAEEGTPQDYAQDYAMKRDDGVIGGVVRTMTDPSAKPSERLSAASMLGVKTGLFGDPKFDERLKAAVKSLDEMPRAMSPEAQMDEIDKLYAPEGPGLKVTYDLNFSAALWDLKMGKRVARKGWNGKGRWLVLVDPKTTTVAKFGAGPTEYAGNAMLDNGSYPILPWIGMKTADDKFVPWLASQTDLLAADWGVLS